MTVKADLMEQLKPQVLACWSCRLRNGASQVVFGEGSPEARLAFVGEGPGGEEDRQGRPFVGPAGKLLDQMLTAMGMNRFEHVYILNVVKCRPPGNRAPDPEEAGRCRTHLDRQLEIIDPDIVVLLGSTAGREMLDPELRISKARGRWIFREGRWWMPTYHPAALLRNPSLKRAVWSDLKQVIDKYRELVDPAHHTPHYPVHSDGQE